MPVKRLSAAVAALAALSGCGLETPPQIVAFDYVVLPFDSAIRDEIVSGARSVDDVLGAAPCAVIVSFDVLDEPSVQQAGSPGDPGYNVTVFSSAPVNASDRNPAACAADTIVDFAVTLGGPGVALDVGDTTDRGQLRITVNGAAFDTFNALGYFAGTLTGPTPSGDPDYVSADFEALARGPSGTQEMIVIKGAFALD